MLYGTGSSSECYAIHSAHWWSASLHSNCWNLEWVPWRVWTQPTIPWSLPYTDVFHVSVEKCFKGSELAEFPVDADVIAESSVDQALRRKHNKRHSLPQISILASDTYGHPTWPGKWVMHFCRTPAPIRSLQSTQRTHKSWNAHNISKTEGKSRGDSLCRWSVCHGWRSRKFSGYILA